MQGEVHPSHRADRQQASCAKPSELTPATHPGVENSKRTADRQRPDRRHLPAENDEDQVQPGLQSRHAGMEARHADLQEADVLRQQRGIMFENFQCIVSGLPSCAT